MTSRFLEAKTLRYYTLTPVASPEGSFLNLASGFRYNLVKVYV
jgi:hypothetical protein